MGDNKGSNEHDFFDALYRKQFPKMWAYAFSLVNHTELAKEIVQDAFVEVLLHIDRLAVSEHPEFWLQRVVKNKALHVRREQARYTWRLVSLEEGQIVDGSAERQLQEVEEADSLSQIRRTIAEKLTPQEIQLLKRITMEGAAYKTVASEMNISIGSCQKKIQRVRKKLRKYVEYH